MLVVETISKIRRAHRVHGKSIKAICRELGVSRKVVRKVLRSEVTEFHYEREAQPLPRIGPWRRELDGLLAELLVYFADLGEELIFFQLEVVELLE